MNSEKYKLLRALYVPAALLALMWLVMGLGLSYPRLDFTPLALHPLHVDGIPGIITAPFLHGSLKHLLSNSLPFLILAWALWYYYPEFATKALIMMWLTTGLWVWLFARNHYHIGASGVVYALAFFHVASALLRRVYGLLAFAMLVIFLYGGLIWGFFPELFPHENISWQSHLMGAVSGTIIAVYYRNKGIQRIDPWDDEDDEDDNGFESIQVNYSLTSDKTTHNKEK